MSPRIGGWDEILVASIEDYWADDDGLGHVKLKLSSESGRHKLLKKIVYNKSLFDEIKKSSKNQLYYVYIDKRVGGRHTHFGMLDPVVSIRKVESRKMCSLSHEII